MKRTSTIVATALSLALVAVPMAGCGSQQASSTAEDQTTETTEVAEQSQEELIAEFKQALENAPAYKSVTVTEDTVTTTKSDSETITSAATLKFDESGTPIRTSAEYDLFDDTRTYYTSGSDAVYVIDGAVYAGTTEQFLITFADGSKAYLNDMVGESEALVNCISSIEKTQADGLTSYLLTLDTEKYIASDEALTMLAESGSAVQEATFAFGFNEDGSIASVDKKLDYEESTAEWHVAYSDYDSTVVDPMPEATNTYEELEDKLAEDIDKLLDDES